MDTDFGNVLSPGSKRGRKHNSIFGLLFPEPEKSGELENSEEEELLETVRKAKNEWTDAINSFEHVYEEELVDYFTYKMKACELRYAYFLKKAKEMGIHTSAAEVPEKRE